MTPLFYAILGVAGLYVFTYCVLEIVRTPERRPVSRENALEAARLTKDWGVWMAGIATASIAANGISLDTALGVSKSYVFSSVLFFSLSILFDAWTLGALPSLVARLRTEDHAENDIFEAKMHTFLWHRFTRIGFLANLQHTCFVLAVFSMAAGIYYAPTKS